MNLGEHGLMGHQLSLHETLDAETREMLRRPGYAE